MYAAAEVNLRVAATKSSPLPAMDFDILPAADSGPQVSAQPVQGALFSGGRAPVRESLRVVPMQPRTHAQKAHSYRRPQPRKDQQRFEFQQPLAPSRVVDEQVIVGNARVAIPMHRVVAAVLDGSLIAIALGLLVIVLYLGGAKIAMDKNGAPLVAGAVVVAVALYRLLWCFAGADSIGMRWVGLQLLNFDGVVPNRAERLHRMVTACISVAAAGLGLVWALVDEEKLTWHDHMSKTFPSPCLPGRS